MMNSQKYSLPNPQTLALAHVVWVGLSALQIHQPRVGVGGDASVQFIWNVPGTHHAQITCLLPDNDEDFVGFECFVSDRVSGLRDWHRLARGQAIPHEFVQYLHSHFSLRLLGR